MNFYDSVQALTGFDLMRKCFSKKINYKNTDNQFERMTDIVTQLRGNYINAHGR